MKDPSNGSRSDNSRPMEDASKCDCDLDHMAPHQAVCNEHMLVQARILGKAGEEPAVQPGAGGVACH